MIALLSKNCACQEQIDGGGTDHTHVKKLHSRSIWHDDCTVFEAWLIRVKSSQNKKPTMRFPGPKCDLKPSLRTFACSLTAKCSPHHYVTIYNQRLWKTARKAIAYDYTGGSLFQNTVEAQALLHLLKIRLLFKNKDSTFLISTKVLVSSNIQKY